MKTIKHDQNVQLYKSSTFGINCVQLCHADHKKKPHVRAWQEVVNLRIYATEW